MADPFERGERAHLNFGHTFGHAIEAVSKFSYSHGESIALGMVAASRAAMKLGMLDGNSVHRIIKLIAAACTGPAAVVTSAVSVVAGIRLGEPTCSTGDGAPRSEVVASDRPSARLPT